MSLSGFECLACATQLASDFDGYRCPNCDSNLDVLYDYQALRLSPLKERFREAQRNDIFRFLPLLPISDISFAPIQAVGNSPLYDAPRLAQSIGILRLYLKDEGLNPSASFKDRASAIALACARERGAAVIAGASTGNAGSSTACLAAGVGMPCVVFVPEKAPPAKIAQLLIFGARVIAVRGSYDDAYKLCDQVCQQTGWFNRNTGFNPFTREGKKTCSFEICEQLDWQSPDRVIVPTGDGNIISGIWKGFRDLYQLGLIPKLPKIDAAQSIGSSAIAQAVKALQAKKLSEIDWSSVVIEPVEANTVADSISVNQPLDGLAAVRAVVESGGQAVSVPDSEILNSISELARLAGIFAEPAAATSIAGLKAMLHNQEVDPDERVVCLITGNGLKDVAAARKVAGDPFVIDPVIDQAFDALGKSGLEI